MYTKQIILMIVFFAINQLGGIMYQKTERLKIFEQVWETVNEEFYDENFNGVNWNNIKAKYRTKITESDSLFTHLNDMLFELNSSHCGVGLLSDITKILSPYIFNEATIGIDIRIIDNQILVTAVSPHSSAASKGIKAGYVIKKINGLSLSEIKNQVVYRPPFNDRNRLFYVTSTILRLLYGEVNTTIKIDFIDHTNKLFSKELVCEKRTSSPTNIGLSSPAFLESYSYSITPQISYISFNAFLPHDLNHVIEKLNKLNNPDGLIIDLRGNDGGSIEGMKLLIGRFITKKKRYGTYRNRENTTSAYIEPNGKTSTGELVILVDYMSISAAENMAGIVQLLNIGMIIGTRTPGQLLWGEGYSLDNNIALVIPVNKIEYINGLIPEDNGITPDIEVQMKREDVLNGKDTQIDEAVKYLNELLNPKKRYE